MSDSLTALTAWELNVLLKIRQLRADGKRAIILLDGTVIWVYRAENAGTIQMTD